MCLTGLGCGVAEPEEKLQRGKGRGGLFFALGRILWPQLWSLETSNRLNFVAAYLVLLAGTGSDHQLGARWLWLKAVAF